MKNVIEKLKLYKGQIDLKSRFNYSLNISDSIFSSSEKETLSKQRNRFDQNVRLKGILSERYKNLLDSTELDFWVINNWGGIKGFKPTERNIKKIQNFRKQLTKRRLSIDSFNTISSLSKISSFIDPSNYVIYDSRVIYSLNWLILTCENQEKLKEKYYPLPNGRNRIIADFDMKTVVNLFHIGEYNKIDTLYINRHQAYFEFCDFVNKATKQIFGEQAEPYLLEMLLFTLVDREVFEELKNRIIITIGKTGKYKNTELNF